ncbi:MULTISPECIES: YceI family protein [Prauserella salsuginis group]|uniref:YceI family protein n=1 Tax=Prauserella salsuginis TaxID=387889 RepID=A0ABW6GA59_9PSEU|nr:MULTISPECIES: YceI family protein [Prauserella salsuginis group]MCR3723084.1 Polyisoprenoid-binding protein YceI [Prauserella flava]MCR3732541.1 Polyisoprenoid-binding protein YceI [Prauserella salsuginis]
MSAATQIPGYTKGTWTIDPVHSEVTFITRHLGVSKVRGQFTNFEGTIVTGDDITDSSVEARIQAGSIHTKNDQRDAHVKSDEFLDVERFPTLSFRSTGIRATGDGYVIDGELTLHGVTKPVSLEAELGGFGDGMTEGSKVVGIEAKTEINRTDFDVASQFPTAVVADKVRIELDIEAVLDN